MGGAETQKGAAAADVVPVVVGVRDAEGSNVLGAVVIGVADERALGLILALALIPLSRTWKDRLTWSWK